jgi:hypothetical protein
MDPPHLASSYDRHKLQSFINLLLMSRGTFNLSLIPAFFRIGSPIYIPYIFQVFS